MTDQHGERLEERYSARDRLLATLMEKVAADPYPSTTMMDIVEENLLPQHVPVYSEILLEKIRADQFPSLDLIKRLSSLA